MFGLVDCNNFYVSCERVFQPRLEGRPVVVLSNNDGCIISRSAEARALGLRMGAPYFKVRDELRRHGVTVFSSNYALYGDMSRRVMHYLGQTAPGVEVYSIDEAFLDLSGLERHLRGHIGGSLEEFARRIRAGVRQRTGLPACVGVAPTKTLAKLANRLAKQDAALGGVLHLDTAERQRWALKQVAVGDVWGVGRRYAQKLAAAGIDSAADLARLGEAWARKHLGGVVGARLVRELRGYPCAGVSSPEDDLRRQSLTCSRTFGRPLHERELVAGAVASFVARAAEKLRRQSELAHVLTVYIGQNRFAPGAGEGGHSRSAVLTLPVPTSDTRELAARAGQLLASIWEPGAVYVKAGVVLAGLEPPGWGQQLGLFGAAPEPAATSAAGRGAALMAALDGLNQQFGRGAVQLAAALGPPGGGPVPWQGQAAWRSPAYTTRLEDLLIVK